MESENTHDLFAYCFFLSFFIMDYRFDLIQSLLLLTAVGSGFLSLVYLTSGYKRKAIISLIVSIISIVLLYFYKQ